MQQVISQDKTKIAFDKIGSGPAVILVEGATGTHDYSIKLATLLSTNFTVYYYDRRGRGESTDTLPYSVEKEIEDISALINEAGGIAYVYGISSGGALALEAASKLDKKITKLVVYEVPYDESEEGIKNWHEYTKNLHEAIKVDNRGEAATLFMHFVGVPEEMLAGMKQSPMWPGMEKVAPTLIYDAACLGEDRVVPVQKAAQITAKTLIIDGGGSLAIMPFMHATAEKLAQVIPNAKRETLEGQTHNVDAKVLASVLEKFFKEE